MSARVERYKKQPELTEEEIKKRYTKELRKMYIKKNGKIKKADRENLTEKLEEFKRTLTPKEFFDLAMKITPSCYLYVPDELKTVKMTDAFLADNYFGIHYVPDKFLTESYVLKVMKKYNQPFGIPERLMTPRLCKKAIKIDPDAIILIRGTKYYTEELLQLSNDVKKQRGETD